MPPDPRPGPVLLAATLMPSVVDALGQALHVLDGRDPCQRARLVSDHASSIRAIATNAHDGASRDLISSLPRLRLIACFSAGVDHIAMDAAAERNIVVTSTSDALADDVADVAIAKCLLLLRGFKQADSFVRDGSWMHGAFPLGRSLKGRRMGLIGMGAIGSAIARRADAMGMHLAYTARTEKAVGVARYVSSVQALAEASDILVVCCPATPETRHLVDAAVLVALGPAGYLVNIARGSIVDEAALVVALQHGRIAGAGLDVFEDEPHPHPALLTMDTVSLSPHLGSGTHEARAAMGRSMIGSLLGYFADHKP